MRSWYWQRFASICLLVVTTLIGGCGGNISSTSIAGSSSTHPHLHMTWMIGQSALKHLNDAGFPPDQEEAYFGTSFSIVMISPQNDQFPASWHSIRAQTFASYTALANAFSTNAINPTLQAIVYDNEHWDFTPIDEQEQPALYEQKAAKLVHAHHLYFIATPAVDLVAVLAPQAKPGTTYAAFLQLGIIDDTARYADYIEIQAQGSEGNISQYQDFVQQAAAQAKAANPNVLVLAGLSTNPDGQQVTSDQLYQAVMATQSLVHGYWMNIPGESAYCPKCGTPQPQVAIDLFNRLW